MIDNYVNETILVGKVEQIREYRKWANKMPVFHFDKEWDVKIIPPFAGALTRFTISYNGKWVSVYFDAYSALGWVYDDEDNPLPYFECYNGENTYRYLLDESEQMMRDVRNYLNN